MYAINIKVLPLTEASYDLYLTLSAFSSTASILTHTLRIVCVFLNHVVAQFTPAFTVYLDYAFIISTCVMKSNTFHFFLRKTARFSLPRKEAHSIVSDEY